jgi:hypothetical protein
VLSLQQKYGHIKGHVLKVITLTVLKNIQPHTVPIRQQWNGLHVPMCNMINTITLFIHITMPTKTAYYKCSQVTMHTLITMGYCLVKLNMCMPYNHCLVCKLYCLGIQKLKWWGGSWYRDLWIWCHYFKWPQSPVTSHWVPNVIHSVYWLTNFHTAHLRGCEVPDAHMYLHVDINMMHKLKTIITRNVINYKQNSWTHQF